MELLKLRMYSKKRGHFIAEKTVGNYMHELLIRALWVSPYKRTTIDPDFDIKLENILDRKFSPNAPITLWANDITYIWILKGFVYLTRIMELFSRKVISWNHSDSFSTQSVLEAISKTKLLRRADAPIIIHSTLFLP